MNKMVSLYVKTQCHLAKKKTKGQSLAEYALILALVSVVAFAALDALGTGVTAKIDEVAAKIGG